MTTKNEDRNTWAIGGIIIVGLGVGLVFVKSSPILLAASIIVGIGLGQVITSILPNKKL